MMRLSVSLAFIALLATACTAQSPVFCLIDAEDSSQTSLGCFLVMTATLPECISFYNLLQQVPPANPTNAIPGQVYDEASSLCTITEPASCSDLATLLGTVYNDPLSCPPSVERYVASLASAGLEPLPSGTSGLGAVNASSAGNSTGNYTMGSGLGRRLVEYIFGPE